MTTETRAGRLVVPRGRWRIKVLYIVETAAIIGRSIKLFIEDGGFKPGLLPAPEPDEPTGAVLDSNFDPYYT